MVLATLYYQLDNLPLALSWGLWVHAQSTLSSVDLA